MPNTRQGHIQGNPARAYSRNPLPGLESAEPGYLGGHLLLAVNFGLSTLEGQIGIFAGMAVQFNLLVAGPW
jgi:hypothetical protein